MTTKPAAKFARLAVFAGLAAAILPGCARSPAGGFSPGPRRQLVVTVVLAERVRAAYNYFIAIDTNGDLADGPVPLIATPSTPIPPTGFPIVISDSDVPPSFIVWLNLGIFRQYRNQILIGPPFMGQVSADGKTITVTLDLDQVSTTATSLDMNLITTDSLIPPEDPLRPINYDGLGPSGNSYLAGIPVGQSARFTNDSSAVPETEGDAPAPELDIVDWTIEVKIL